MSAVVDIRPALLEQLKDLHLPTVRECYEDTARRAERETLSYEQYLLEVITRECEQRRKSKVQRLLKDSALPLEKSLQNFDLKRLPAKAARQVRTLLDGSFLDRKENIQPLVKRMASTHRQRRSWRPQTLLPDPLPSSSHRHNRMTIRTLQRSHSRSLFTTRC